MLIQSEAGLTPNEAEQCKIIAEHFKTRFMKNADALPNVHPKKMRTPFTKVEVTIAIKKLKNNKNTGFDEVFVELSKYAPDIVHKQRAEIYNEMAATGEYPIEITQGLLCAIQKPG